jgi:hypothetical protein
MFLLRIVGLLTAIAVGAGITAFLFTGDRRYLGLAWRIVKYALIFALALFALLAFERLLVMI